MASQVVKVRRETLEACMTCPLCNKLLEEATTISECLHTFCRKCIYEKLTDEELDHCPTCNLDLGCCPEEKLRPDHSLQDIRSKVFPLKGRKIEAPEIEPEVPLPVRRKERSLSSLVVSTPRVSNQTGLTGRRTKAYTRKAASLRGSNFDEEPIKEERNSLVDYPESSSSPEMRNKSSRRKVMEEDSVNVDPSNHHMPNKVGETDAQQSWTGKGDPWEPLDCLVEAANGTKSLNLKSQGSSSKMAQDSGLETEQNEATPSPVDVVRPRKAQRMSRKKAAASVEQVDVSPQAIIDAGCFKLDRKDYPIWLQLQASEDQNGDAPLPQVPSRFLKIKDGDVPVSYVQKYLAMKLGLASENEVNIYCLGQLVVPSLQLHNLVDLWLQSMPASQRVSVTVGSSAKDFVMVLVYSRNVNRPE